MGIKKNKNKAKENDFNFIDQQILENLENRPISFYINMKKSLSRISTIFMVLSIIFIVSGKTIIEYKNKNKQDYVTNVFGKNVEYIQTERRQEIVREFLEYQNNN